VFGLDLFFWTFIEQSVFLVPSNLRCDDSDCWCAAFLIALLFDFLTHSTLILSVLVKNADATPNQFNGFVE
jgi:hypothetical protein